MSSLYIWFQDNSEKPGSYNDHNGELLDFLDSIIDKFTEQVRRKIEFRVVDMANNNDVAMARKHNILMFPTLVVNDRKFSGINNIKSYVSEMMRKAATMPRQTKQRQIQSLEDAAPTSGSDSFDTNDDLQKIRTMWETEMDKDDQEDAESDEVKDRHTRAQTMASRRKQLTERREPIRQRKKGMHQQQTRQRPQQRQRQRDPEPEDEDDGELSPQEDEPPQRRPAAKKGSGGRERRGKTTMSTVDIIRSLPGTPEERGDDGILAGFWEGTQAAS